MGTDTVTRMPPAHPTTTASAPRDIAVLAYPGAYSIDVVGPFEVFEAANVWLTRHGHKAAYRVRLMAPQAGPLRTESGLKLVADIAYPNVRRPIDTLIVAGGDVSAMLHDQRLLRWLRRDAYRRLASVCTGAFLLAQAGVLDGRRATTHWAFTRKLAGKYPQVQVVDDAIFVQSDHIYTSAGVTAGIDLALALVAADLGKTLALEVARHLVVFFKRPGGQSQFSSQLAAQGVDNGQLARLLQWMLEHPGADMRVQALAQRARMSERNFCRVFARELGATPAKFVERIRLDAARRLLAESSLNLDQLAVQSGFGDAARMRKSFLRQLGITPSDYRERFSGPPLSPALPN